MQEVREDLTCAGGIAVLTCTGSQGRFCVCRRPYRVYPGWQRLATSTTAAEVDDEHGEQDAEAGEDHRAQVE